MIDDGTDLILNIDDKFDKLKVIMGSLLDSIKSQSLRI